MATRQRLSASPLVSPPPEAPTLAEAIANLPERWYIAHPEFLTNPEKAAQVQYCHWVARRETGEEFTEPYFDRMEALLGVEREMRSYGNGAQPDTIPTEPQQRDTAPRTSAPPVRRQASAGLVSAPPTRDVLSMTSGRPASEPLRLTREEQELARTLGLTDSQYIEGKKRMMAEKAAGLHGR